MFKFFRFGKLQLISINFNSIILSILLLTSLILFKINFIIEELDFNDVTLESASSGYSLVNFIILVGLKLLFIIHIFYSIQSIFFDYLNNNIKYEGIKIPTVVTQYISDLVGCCKSVKNFIIYQFTLVKPLLEFLDSHSLRRGIYMRLFTFENSPIFAVGLLMLVIFLLYYFD
jgi:hypothetical protein